MRLLAECFEEAGGVPHVVLADRMGCLRGGVVANVVVPTPDYVRFATHYGFRPDFCEAADPESKGLVEALCRYAQVDLVVPAEGWSDEAEANAAARDWCDEVNAQLHSEIAAVPNDRIAEERQVLRPLPSLRPVLFRGETRKVDKLATVRFGSARYSVPKRARRTLRRGPGCRWRDPRPPRSRARRRPSATSGPGRVLHRRRALRRPETDSPRAVRPRSGAERACLALGPAAEAFLRAAAAAGTSKLGTELAQITACRCTTGCVA